MARRMQTVAPPAAPAQAPGTPQAGRWTQSVHADVTVPFEASAITGAMITSIVLLIAGIVIYWQRWSLVDVLIPLTLGALGIWLGTTLIFWFRERRDIKTTWWRAEERDQTDYDGDGRIGGGKHAVLLNPVQARREAAAISESHARSFKTAELLSFMSRCAAVGTSEGKLNIGTSPKARADYAVLRDALIGLGIGAWRDETRHGFGWTLTMTPEQAAPIISKHVRELQK